MTREEIRRSVNYCIADGDRYNLEKLPVSGDYDSVVNDYINELEYNHKHDKDYYDILVDELVDYYFINQDEYEF